MDGVFTVVPMGFGVFRIEQAPDPFDDGPNPNDVSEAMEPGVVLDDVDGTVLAEVAAVRRILRAETSPDLIPVDYGAKLRLYGLLPPSPDGDQAG